MNYQSSALALGEHARPQRLFALTTQSPQRAARPRRVSAVLAQSSDNANRARMRFEDGVRLANGLQWTQAAQAFEESYQLFPRVNTLFNLGLAHRALGRYTRAIDELERFVREGEPSAAERAQVSSALDEMRGRLAHLTIVPSVDGARITMDNEPVESTTDLTVDPGNHVIEVTAQGHTRNAQTISLSPSETRTLNVRLERGGGVPVGAVVGIIAGVVAAGVVTGILIWQLSGEEMAYCGTLEQCISPQ
ncbi:MAG: PEGA domain-containing protein [Deltaproteobacteria bacterium]|nr:PEGA domain-containing protein [Deltaproteobacteria bacterium]